MMIHKLNDLIVLFQDPVFSFGFFTVFFNDMQSAAQSEVSFASWNPRFQPILASTSHNGVTGEYCFILIHNSLHSFRM